MKKILTILLVFIAIICKGQVIFVKDTMVTDSTKYVINLKQEYIANYTNNNESYILHFDYFVKVDNKWKYIPKASYVIQVEETNNDRKKSNRDALFTYQKMVFLRNNLLLLLQEKIH